MAEYTLLAPCLFGLESILSHEAGRIGGENIKTEDGRVFFTGDDGVLARANLLLRCAERVCVVLGSFRATTFTELFDGVAALPFEDFVGKKDAFPVKGWSLKSTLHSVPSCQSIIKKAAVRRMEKAYGQTWFEESGSVHQIQFSILKDQVTVMLDTSGAGLHKRGYRKTSTEAPIKETLAAGIVDLARVREGDTVYDPMCGSGTFLIEAALRAFYIAPGIRRKFAAESWSVVPKAVWKEEREKALAEIEKSAAFRGFGWDNDPEAVSLTLENAVKAGVGKKILTAERDIRDFAPEGDGGIVFVNPPYGERLLEIREAENLYRELGKVYARNPGLKWYIISPHEDFERLFGKKADKRRKLYNGMIKCQLFMYFK